MSFSTFSALKTTIAAWLWRANDTDLTTYVPDMVSMCEAELNRRIKTRQRVAEDDFTIAAEFAAVPSDFAGVVAFRLSSTDPDARLKYIDPDKAAELITTTYTD